MKMRDLPHQRKMYIMGGVLLAMLLGALDGTIVGPAMPTITGELGGLKLLAWVFTMYAHLHHCGSNRWQALRSFRPQVVLHRRRRHLHHRLGAVGRLW